MAEIAKQYAEENNPLGVHYDASKEVRAKGAGFYQFSGDEETRKAQMEELKASREETERVRQELGAEDVKFGEVEGMRAGEITGGSTAGPSTSRAMEKRKHEIEERRRLLESKRRKTTIVGMSNNLVTPDQDGASLRSPAADQGASHAPVMSIAETPQQVQSGNAKESSAKSIKDPFAALEAQATVSSVTKGKGQTSREANDADSFLASLEKEFLASRVKK